MGLEMTAWYPGTMSSLTGAANGAPCLLSMTAYAQAGKYDQTAIDDSEHDAATTSAMPTA